MAKARVLVVDDDPSGRYLLETILTSGDYEVMTAEDGVEALEVAKYDTPDLVVADILMPRMDGYQLCRDWKANPELSPIPLVFYTANYADEDDETFALSLGADAFLRKPMQPQRLLEAIDSILDGSGAPQQTKRRLAVEDETRVLKAYNARLVSKLEEQLAELHEINDVLRDIVSGTVTAIGKLTEARDPYTSGHQERVAAIATAIAVRLGYDVSFCEGIRVAGLVHDVGKIYVPAEILTKPRRLSDAEFAIIREHPRVGFEVLKDVKFPWPIAEYVVHHHERLDGSGYPDHLAGDELSIGARILAVADVVEAMSSHRPYKTAAGIDRALEEIEDNAGKLYDTDVSAACLELFRTDNFQIPQVADAHITG